MAFVVVNVYDNYVPAHIAMGVLREEGINCWLKDENTVTIDPILTNAVGGIKLMVDERQAERAREFLETLKKEHRSQTACPKCGSSNMELVSTPRKAANWISALATFFAGDYAVPVKKVYHCFDCGHEFEEPVVK